MACSGTYGDHITLMAISEIFDIQIVVVSDNKDIGATLISNTIDDKLKNRPYMLLGHNEEGKGEHYVSLEAVVKDHQWMLNLLDKKKIHSFSRPQTATKSVPSKDSKPSSCYRPPIKISSVRPTRSFTLSDWITPKHSVEKPHCSSNIKYSSGALHHDPSNSHLGSQATSSSIYGALNHDTSRSHIASQATSSSTSGALDPVGDYNHDSRNKYTRDKCITNIAVKKGERAKVICAICSKFPDIARQCYPKGRLPPICDVGTEARSSTIAKHLEGECHMLCVRAQRVNNLSSAMKVKEVPILRNISEKNLEVGNRIGRLMIQVFIDAKSLSLSAYSWPSRVVAGEMAAGFDFNKPYLPYEASAFDLQYVNPSFHRELLHTIVQAHVPTFINEIEANLAGSFRCDASWIELKKTTSSN